MWIAVWGSAIVFGLIHIGNVGVGAAFGTSVVQALSAMLCGVFLAAVYFRTGNILYTMFYHAMEDVIVMMDPAQVTDVMTQTTFSVLDLTIILGIGVLMAGAGIYLLRKSKWEEIQSTWANIWNE